uniref:Uncharacterized protein n=1 Tax=Peronospora matthiolae TaxID=2874970 RepID=A0AAV1TVW8_9STRA
MRPVNLNESRRAIDLLVCDPTPSLEYSPFHLLGLRFPVLRLQPQQMRAREPAAAPD